MRANRKHYNFSRVLAVIDIQTYNKKTELISRTEMKLNISTLEGKLFLSKSLTDKPDRKLGAIGKGTQCSKK